ncbi:MAG: hypothetical protein JW867_06870 [Candidatus Omnitrophica bacterium]|nr:hypothetical protein [Candidatus Omnitrophota bacterium]
MRGTINKALIVFLLDAFVFNLGAFAVITLVIVIPVIIIKAINIRKNKTKLKKRLKSCCIYLAMSILIFTANGINNKIAENRAKILIEACEKYKKINNKYPDKLQDLVPIFISKVPAAKYTLASNKFYYLKTEDSHILFYMHIPPFGRPTYNFEKKQWAYMD